MQAISSNQGTLSGYIRVQAGGDSLETTCLFVICYLNFFFFLRTEGQMRFGFWKNRLFQKRFEELTFYGMWENHNELENVKDLIMIFKTVNI